MSKFIWQQSDWPTFKWNSARLLSALGECRQHQGRLLGAIKALGVEATLQAQAEALVQEAVTTSEIEDVRLAPDAVRSSVARRLGLPDAGLAKSDRAIEGLVDVLLDASRNFGTPLDKERLFGWHAALFPSGYSGLKKINVGQWRPADEPMRVVSGPIGKERVHFVAPAGDMVAHEMERFFIWWNQSLGALDGLLRAGLAHLFFVTIHPFQDGNGRIARALTDLAMAQDEQSGTRCYSLSAQLRSERLEYYAALEAAQRGTTDVTAWLEWFFGAFTKALEGSGAAVDKALTMRDFWQRLSGKEINARQRKILNRLLETKPKGFEGGLSNKNYRAVTKASQATATRDLAQLVEWGALKRSGEGRSVRYEIVLDLDG